MTPHAAALAATYRQREAAYCQLERTGILARVEWAALAGAGNGSIRVGTDKTGGPCDPRDAGAPARGGDKHATEALLLASSSI